MASLLLASSGVTGALVGWVGGVAWSAVLGPALNVWALSALVAGGVLLDALGVAPLSVLRQVPQLWGRIFSAPVVAVLYGGRLGVGPLTILRTWLWWASFVAGASAGPWWGAGVGAAFGVARTLAMLAAGARAGGLQSRERAVSFVLVASVLAALVLVGAVVGDASSSGAGWPMAGPREPTTVLDDPCADPTDGAASGERGLEADPDHQAGPNAAAAAEGDADSGSEDRRVEADADARAGGRPDDRGATAGCDDDSPPAATTSTTGDAATTTTTTADPADAALTSELSARLPESLLPHWERAADDAKRRLGPLDLAAAAAAEADTSAERALLETRHFRRGHARGWRGPQGEVAYASVYEFAAPADAAAYLVDGITTIEARGARVYDVAEPTGGKGFSQAEQRAANEGSIVSHGVAFVEGSRFFLVFVSGNDSSVDPTLAAEAARSVAGS